MKNDIEIIPKNWFEEEIKNKQVKAYIEYILKYKNSYLNWYLEHRKKARQNSWKHLLPALIFFGLSLILPLLTGIEFSDKYQISYSTFYALGYISLIISTLLLLADRLFIHSKSWIRYTITLNQIEAISSKYYAKWIINLADINSNVDGTIQLLNDFDNELKDVIKTETDNWKDLFTGQLDEFNKQASDRFKNSENKITDFTNEMKNNPKASNKVNLEIKFINLKPEQKIKVELYQDGKVVKNNDIELNYPKWNISNIFDGTYLLVFEIYESDKLLRKDSRFITLKKDVKVHTELIEINSKSS